MRALTCMQSRKHMHTHARTGIHTHAHRCTHTCAHMHVHTSCAHTCIYIHMHAHIHTYMYAHAHLHTHTRMPLSFQPGPGARVAAGWAGRVTPACRAPCRQITLLSAPSFAHSLFCVSCWSPLSRPEAQVSCAVKAQEIQVKGASLPPVPAHAGLDATWDLAGK